MNVLKSCGYLGAGCLSELTVVCFCSVYTSSVARQLFAVQSKMKWQIGSICKDSLVLFRNGF